MRISNDTRLLLQILRRAYPWARYVSRSHGPTGALRLHDVPPKPTDKGFMPTGEWVDLDPDMLLEVPEGVMVGMETLLESEDKDI